MYITKKFPVVADVAGLGKQFLWRAPGLVKKSLSGHLLKADFEG